MALISVYFVLSALITLSVGFAYSSINELSTANRYKDSTKSFWLAESAINDFIANTNMLDAGQAGVACDQSTNTCEKEFTVDGYAILLQKQDTTDVRYVAALAEVKGHQRQIQVEFPKVAPDVFDNTMSSGGNITMTGALAILDVYGKTRLSGTFTKSGIGTSAWFEDKQQGVSNTLTTLKYPDANNNGTTDEFTDFVEFNRDIVSTYAPGEVVYIQSNSTQNIVPNSQLAGIKIIYVEGTAPGTGDVNIIFNASWQANQNITVISTGDVTYIQPLTVATNSQLNVIAWSDYSEPAILWSTHDGMTFAHGTARFRDVLDLSTTNGVVVGNNGIATNEIIAHKIFNFGDPLDENNQLPPAFEGLVTGSSSGSSYVSTPNSWKEI